MIHTRKIKSRIDFHRRYAAYARNHSMTQEQMLAHDRQFWPDAMLNPFLLWCSCKKVEWHCLQLAPDSDADEGFDKWLDGLQPDLDALTCACHKQR